MSDQVDLFENQRYSFNGWSSTSLLPAVVDPFAFVTSDGLDGWHSINEADTALLSKGWSWTAGSSWSPSIDLKSTDVEGWIYAVNFSFIDEGVKEKGTLHFVRRRKLQRPRVFNISSLLDVRSISDCYCDSEEVDRVALQLLTALSAASHHRHPTRLSSAQMNALKTEFAQALFLDGDVLNMTHEVSHTQSDLPGAPLLPQKHKVTSNSHSRSEIAHIKQTTGDTQENESHHQHKLTPWEAITLKIDQFAKKDKSVWLSALQSDDNVEALIHRTVEVADRHFEYLERSEFAKLLIRCHDMDFRFHCHRDPSIRSETSGSGSDSSNRLCTPENCIFAPYSCVNQECPVVISRKWREKHDSSCMNKAVSCQRNCGDKIMRKLMHIHMATECNLRPVKCPFNDIGCDAELVQAAVSAHLSEHVSDHLTLAVCRIHEQQVALKAQSSQIEALRGQYEQQLQLADAVQTGMGAVHALIEASEKRQQSALGEATTKQDIVTTRKLHEVNSTLQLEVNKLTHAIADLHIQLKEVRALVSTKK